MGVFFYKRKSLNLKQRMLIMENKTVKYSESAIKELNKIKLNQREQEILVKLMAAAKKSKQS